MWADVPIAIIGIAVAIELEVAMSVAPTLSIASVSALGLHLTIVLLGKWTRRVLVDVDGVGPLLEQTFGRINVALSLLFMVRTSIRLFMEGVYYACECLV